MATLPPQVFQPPQGLRLTELLRGHLLFAFILTLWILTIAGSLILDGVLAWSAGVFYISYDTALLAYVGWKTRGLAATAASPATTLPAIRTAVLVPARNECSVLPGCIDALLAQTTPAEEIWIVDDGSVDGSSAMLAARYAVIWEGDSPLGCSAKHPSLRVWRKRHTGKAASLNLVWPMTAAELIVTIDADTVCAPGAIAGMRQAFAVEPALAAACGMLRPRCGEKGVGARVFEGFQMFEYLRAFLARAAWRRSNALLLVSGAFAGYRRVVLEQLGGYDPRSLVEDYELIHRLHRHSADHGLGWTVGVVSDARAVTDAPADFRTFLRQRRRWFAGFLETQFTNRDMVGNRRYGAVGRLMLPIKAVDTLQPVYGISAFVLLVLFVLDWRPLALSVLLLIAGKLVIDFIYHLWALHRYHRWLGERPGLRLWGYSMLVTLVEPFSFQLLRHTGAVWGWYSFLTQSMDWTPQRKPGEST